MSESTKKDFDIMERSPVTPRSQMENYRLLFEHSRMPVIVVEPDTTISMVNRSFLELTGLSRESVEGTLSFVDLLPDEEKSRLTKYHRDRRKGEGLAPSCYEARFVRNDGEERIVSICVDLIKETSQSVIYVEDLTERRQREEKSQRQAKTLAALHSIAALTASRDPLEKICSAAMEAALELTSTCGGAVFAPHRISQTLDAITVRSLSEQEVQLLTTLLEERKHEWSQDSARHRCHQYALSFSGEDTGLQRRIESALIFPLQLGPQNVGVLAFVVSSSGALPPGEEEFLTAISNHLASAFRLHMLTQQQEEKISHLQILKH